MSKADEMMDDVLSVKQRMITAIVDKQNELQMQSMKDYFKEKYPNEYVNITFLDESKVNEVIKLGISEYKRRHRDE